MAGTLETPSVHCQDLSHPNIPNFVFSILLCLGILISYLPQHYRIIHRRTSEAISPYYVLLGSTSCTGGLANILLLPESRADLACCKYISGFPCFAGALGVIQVTTQWTCFTIILLLYLLFFPRLPRNSIAKPLSSTHPSYTTAVLVTFISLANIIAVFIISLFFLFVHPSQTYLVATIFGILSAALSAVQYLPQIWTTYQLKRVGSLSIPMMCIQTPGAFVWAGSLAARYGTRGWSVWGVYLVTGTLQGCLLVMAITYELRERKAKKNGLANGNSDGNGPIQIIDQEAEEDEPGEDAPLLGGER